jgi:hypothetical protein
MLNQAERYTLYSYLEFRAKRLVGEACMSRGGCRWVCPREARYGRLSMSSRQIISGKIRDQPDGRCDSRCLPATRQAEPETQGGTAARRSRLWADHSDRLQEDGVVGGISDWQTRSGLGDVHSHRQPVRARRAGCPKQPRPRVMPRDGTSHDMLTWGG